MLDFLTFAICAPYSETTSGSTFDTILELVAARGHSFYHLFQYPSMTIVKGFLIDRFYGQRNFAIDLTNHKRQFVD